MMLYDTMAGFLLQPTICGLRFKAPRALLDVVGSIRR